MEKQLIQFSEWSSISPNNHSLIQRNADNQPLYKAYSTSYKIELYEMYQCKIKSRPEFKGRKIRDDLDRLDRMEFNLFAMWLQDNEDPYPGEFAMGETGTNALSIASDNKLVWISSGDVEIIHVI